MDIESLEKILGMEAYADYSSMSAREFCKIVKDRLVARGFVRSEVYVPDRGDGRGGKIDIVFTYNGIDYPIEVDRVSPRAKSIFKVKSYGKRSGAGFVITRAPFNIFRYG